jgi:hypothetical protein
VLNKDCLCIFVSMFKEYLWGYGSGVAAAIIPPYGDVVLVEFTQPFNEDDVTYSENSSDPLNVGYCPATTEIHMRTYFTIWSGS